MLISLKISLKKIINFVKVPKLWQSFPLFTPPIAPTSPTAPIIPTLPTAPTTCPCGSHPTAPAAPPTIFFQLVPLQGFGGYPQPARADRTPPPHLKTTKCFDNK